MKREEFITERTRIISEMLDNPDKYGIYPTTKCFEQLDALFDKLSLPPAEGADEILCERDDAEDFLQTKDIWNHPRISDRTDKESYEVADLMAEFAQDFATLHAQKIADKMKEANQFILDIAQMLGIETDGVGFDGITLSIDDFREAADKMVEEQCIDFANWLDKLQPSDRTSVWSKNGEHKGLFTMDNQQLYEKYLKSRDSHDTIR